MAIEQRNGRKRLTDFEVAIIAAIAGGASDLEVAAQLYLSQEAVRRHVRSAMRKWAARDRRQIVSLWADATKAPKTTPTVKE
jgi:DNA-binding NarL/FixJ family response regulator